MGPLRQALVDNFRGGRGVSDACATGGRGGAKGVRAGTGGGAGWGSGKRGGSIGTVVVVASARAAMKVATTTFAAVLLLAPAIARAQPIRLEDLSYEAGEVVADPTMRTLTLRRHVVVVYKRYRLESEALTLRITPRGIYVD